MPIGDLYCGNGFYRCHSYPNRGVKRPTPTVSRLLGSLSVGNESTEEVFMSRHMYISAKIKNTPLTSLIDTGASGFAFISKSLCDQLNLSFKVLHSPINLVGLQGKTCAQITHHTIVPLTIGRHQELISAFLIHPCKDSLILGLP